MFAPKAFLALASVMSRDFVFLYVAGKEAFTSLCVSDFILL